MKILIATHSTDKKAEIEKIFSEYLDSDFEIVDGIDPGEVVEDGDTLQENAMIKANAWLDINQDCIVLSDDTGFFVDALDGEPGVYSARYAGEHASYEENCKKLMKEIGDNPNRNSYFATCAIAVKASSVSIIAEGKIEGLVALEPRGNGGFGYDPIFIPGDDLDGATYAEMSMGQKNMISHRSKAFRALAMGIKNAGW